MLFSEEDVLAADALHPLFGSQEHYVERYTQTNFTQKQRLDALSGLLHATTAAFRKFGMPVFLESSTLIGHLRHDGQIPWDNDVDIGMLESDCFLHELSREKLGRFLPKQYEVLKMGC